MTSWGRSFRGAFAIVAFGVLWFIVGILLILTGLGMMGMSLFFNPLGSSTIPWVSQISGAAGFILGIILLVLGIALALLGFLASFLKVLTEMTAEEVAKRSAPLLPPQAMSPPTMFPPPPPM